MVEIINKSVCRGIAGRRASAIPDGTVWHNDAGSIYATAKAYVESLAAMTNAQLANGFAHYYVDRLTRARVEDTYNQAWHTGNQNGNANYVGYETCQSLGASDADFLANEQETFKQMAEDFLYWKKTPDRNNFKLHCEFVPTACPHRSMLLHTGWNTITQGKAPQANVDKLKDYGISQVKKYMNNPTAPTESRPNLIAQGHAEPAKSGLCYRSHVQTSGWLGYVYSGVTSGTTGKHLRMEAVEILIDNKRSHVGIEAHVQSYGWLKEQYGVAGTVGQAKRLEAVKLRLVSDLAKTHDIVYRVHVQGTGWTPWVKNGAVAGTTGKALRMEAIEIKLVGK